MKQNDFREFANYLVGVGMSFDKEIKPEVVLIYFETLKSEFNTITDFKNAAMGLLRSWKYGYMPKPAHFIEMTKVSDEEMEMMALSAWNDTKDAISSIGYIRTPEFEDPIISDIIDSFNGWEELCSKRYDELDWIRKEFIKLYKMKYKTNSVRDVNLKSLTNEKIKIEAEYQVLKIEKTPQIENKILNKTKLAVKKF